MLFAFLINLLLFALVVAVVWWVLGIVANAVGVPANIMQILRAIVVLIFLVYLIGGLTGHAPLLWRP